MTSQYFSNIDIGLMVFYTAIAVVGIFFYLSYRDVLHSKSK